MFGNPYQVKVYSMQRLETLIEENNGINPCFISVCQYDQEPYLTYVPFDLDGSNAKHDVSKLCRFFDLNGLTYRVIFSGNGYHVYLRVVEHHYTDKDLFKFQRDIIDGLRLKSADPHIVGDVKRLMRIPGTINEKNGKLCKEIFRTENQTPQLDLLLWENDATYFDKVKFNESTNILDMRISELHTYPCLDHFIKEDEPPHLARVFYVIYKIIEGYSDLQIFRDLEKKGWVDWNPKIVWYQIKHIRNGKYILPRCKTLKKYNLCIDCRRGKINERANT